MKYTEYQPSPELARYVECVWFVHDKSATAANVADRVFPDGCIEWIFHLQSGFQALSLGHWHLQPRSFVVGEMTSFLLLQPTGPVATMGVRFRPGGAYRFLPRPVDALTDAAIATGDVWGSAGDRLVERVLNASDDSERVKMVEQFLTEQMTRTAPRLRLEVAVRELVRHRGLTRIDVLAENIGWSRRQLEREFRVYAGLTPKALARIIRFQNLLRVSGERRLREWATLALEVGYSDQPHMVREFQEFTGHSPTQQQATIGDFARHFISPRRLSILLGDIG